MVWKGSRAMNAEYNKLITKTFCDNAIRSVMMIDDEYAPYHELVSVAENATSLDEVKGVLKASSKASSMQKYFEKKKFICDVSNGVDSFDTEKARKSDLLILDYQLDNGSPELSLTILNKLSKTQHMNLVVIYTNEDLEKVWLEIAASIRGCGSFDVESQFISKDFSTIWDELTEDGDSLPEEWNNFVNNDLAQYFKGVKPPYKSFTGGLAPEHKRHCRVIYDSSIAFIAKSYDKLNGNYEYVDIEGSFNGQKWLKFGNVFIALHSKVDNECASKIWESLTYSLQDWQPNY